jgi:hypothetical protein
MIDCTLNDFRLNMNTSLPKIVLLAFILECCAASQPKHDPVCIAKTGEKYHLCDCRYVDKGSEEISQEDAIQRNFIACSVCKPDVLVSSADSSVTDNPSNQFVTPQQSQQQVNKQCASFTKSGLRCKRKAAENSDKCWQHQ